MNVWPFIHSFHDLSYSQACSFPRQKPLPQLGLLHKSLEAQARIRATEPEAIGQDHVDIIPPLGFQGDVVAAELVFLSRFVEIQSRWQYTLMAH